MALINPERVAMLAMRALGVMPAKNFVSAIIIRLIMHLLTGQLYQA
jgi:hypothetical protein